MVSNGKMMAFINALGGGSASAGGGIFRVVCKNGIITDDIGEGAMMGLIYTPDKTGPEILSAFTEGKYVFIDCIGTLGASDSIVRVPVLSFVDGAMHAGVVVNGASFVCVITWDDLATTVLYEVYPPAGV